MRRRNRGFTLIEVVVALSILAMSILLVSRAFLIILQVTNQGGNRTVASSLAVRVLEEVRSRPESQSNTVGWLVGFGNVLPAGPTTFGAPYTNYAFRVFVNEVDLNPSTAYPCWLTAAPPGPCTPGANHANTIKWVTVRVMFVPTGQVQAEVSSAVIGDMYRRP
ncbi:MAG: type IV pilus modification PilV family protein [Armatimonadota bacterium]